MSEYKYVGSLVELKPFFKEMKVLNIDIACFNHMYNNIYSNVIFDTRNEWKLVFIKIGIGDVLNIPIGNGYKFIILGNDAYRKFIEYFAIGGGKGVFSIKEFINNLNDQIPKKYQVTDNMRKCILKYDKIDNDIDNDGIYPVGVINWAMKHAKHPEIDPEKYHRRPENLLKTKQLYPDIYNATKNMDISIKYGVNSSEKTKEILNIEDFLNIY